MAESSACLSCSSFCARSRFSSSSAPTRCLSPSTSSVRAAVFSSSFSFFPRVMVCSARSFSRSNSRLLTLSSSSARFLSDSSRVDCVVASSRARSSRSLESLLVVFLSSLTSACVSRSCASRSLARACDAASSDSSRFARAVSSPSLRSTLVFSNLSWSISRMSCFISASFCLSSSAFSSSSFTCLSRAALRSVSFAISAAASLAAFFAASDCLRISSLIS
mmetsp:Transcript_27290/g.89360  ORF Transcript_27290/g.89360 Transcript_27290/m.89360 type:complete len:221 (-) Transcript_27290:523-1185(-)